MQNPDFLFIWIPRDFSKKYKTTENIKIIPWLNCYEIIMECDYHVTVYSTCALEAVTLGISTVLINIDNFSNIFYKEYDNKLLKIVNTIDEFLSHIRDDNLKLINKEVLSLNYKGNLESIKILLSNKGII